MVYATLGEKDSSVPSLSNMRREYSVQPWTARGHARPLQNRPHWLLEMAEKVDCDQHCGRLYSHVLHISSPVLQHHSFTTRHGVHTYRDSNLGGCGLLCLRGRGTSSVSGSLEVQGRMVSETSAIPTDLRQPSWNRSFSQLCARLDAICNGFRNRPDNLGCLARSDGSHG